MGALSTTRGDRTAHRSFEALLSIVEELVEGKFGGFDQFVAVGLRLEFEEVDDRFVFVSRFRWC